MQALFLTLGLLVASFQATDMPKKAVAQQSDRPWSYYEGPLDSKRLAPVDSKRLAPAEAPKTEIRKVEKVEKVYYTPGTYYTPSYYSSYYYPTTPYYFISPSTTYYYGGAPATLTYSPAPVVYSYGVAPATAAYSYGVVTVGPKSMPEGYLIKTTAPAPAAPATYYGSYPVPAPGYIYVWP